MPLPLTDTKLRTIKPGLKSRKIADEKGLYLEVTPSGGRWWRLKYRFAGKERRISLGVYPDVSLKEARDARDAAKKLLSSGIDPSSQRKADKLRLCETHTNNFEAITREWFSKYAARWATNYSTRLMSMFERSIFPYIGNRPVAEITAPELLTVIRRIENTSLDVAHRAVATCGRVFRYAIATGRAANDPTYGLKGALPPKDTGHFAATTEASDLAPILRAFDSYEGTPTVQAALRLMPLLFVRPGELRTAEWSAINLSEGEWRYTINKTKTEHIVPLSRQAIAILSELLPLTGRSKYVFPSARSTQRPMSDNALLAAMRRMDIGKDEQTGHGFRATARTILDEKLRVRPDIIEHQLGHTVRDPLGRAYNRTQFLSERRKMMQDWADYLDNLKFGAQVVSIRKAS